MKARLLIILITTITIVFNVNAYEFDVKDISIINYNDTTSETIINIKNTSETYLWMWFDKESYSNGEKEIKEHLNKRKDDFSIFDIATDANMSGRWWQYPMPLDLFVKCINPKQTFTVILYNNKFFYTKDYLRKVIKIFTNYQVSRYLPGIDTEYGIKRISYPYDAIALDISQI